MTFNRTVRQLHRWLSIAFTLAVLVNLAAMGSKEPALWIGLLALVPLIFLMISGLYLFALPYVAKRHRRTSGQTS